MGEQDRNALITGEAKLTMPNSFVRFEQLARRPDYLGRGFEPQSDPDSQNLFHAGPCRDLPGWFLGDQRLPLTGRFRDRVVPAAYSDGGRYLL